MGLYENMKSEAVSSLDCRTPAIVAPDATIREVISAMRKADIGCAVLADAENRPCGLFTEGMLTRLLAAPVDYLSSAVKEHVEQVWPQVVETDSIASVLAALTSKNTRFLVVVNEEGKISGITGQKGLMEYVADHFPGQVTVQRVGQKPFMHTREGA